MKKASDAPREPAIEIRFGQVGMAQMRVLRSDPEAIQAELAARVTAAPHLFERSGVCIDLSSLLLDLKHEPSAAETRAIVDAVRGSGMLPVGLAYGSDMADRLARELDLPVLTQFRAQSRNTAGVKIPEAPAVAPAPAPAPAPAAPVHAAEPVDYAAPALMHHRPVRSGQRIYGRNRDLVITSAVGAGSEVIADGCVHVYGSLRGRAVAGARGELTARVFCQEFHAELISIAGVFRVFETIPPELAGKPVQAWLEGDDLKFARIGS